MNLSQKLLHVAAIAFVPMLCGAQTVVNTVNDISWSLRSFSPPTTAFYIMTDHSSGDSYTEGKADGIIKIDDKSIVANVQLDANNYAVIRLNKDLSTQWLTNVSGYPIAIGMFNHQVLAICAASVSQWQGIQNDYIGYLIDPATGNVNVQKEMYNGGDDFYQQPVFLFAPDGSFFKLAVRTSAFSRGVHNPLLMFRMNKVAAQYFTTTDFQVLDFDGELNVKTTIKPVLEQGYFLGATTNSKGDVFLMTDYSQGFIKIARYENGKTDASKVLQQPISMSDEIFHNVREQYLITSKTDPEVVYFAGAHHTPSGDKELVVSKFNFNDGTVSGDAQLMDKDYIKNLEKSFVPVGKFKSADLGQRNDLGIRNVIENNGQLIVALSSFSEHSGNAMTRTPPTIYANDVLINIYDNKCKLQHQQIIPRSYETPSSARVEVGLHCNDNSLFVVVNNNKGLFGFKAIFGQIDLKTGEAKSITAIDKSDVKDKYAIDPVGTLWFGDQFVLSYMEDKGLFETSVDAHMQVLTY